MNIKYVLISNCKEQYKDWYMIINEYNPELIAKAIDLSMEKSIENLLNGNRKDYDLNLLEKMKKVVIENYIKYLNQNMVILVNRNGGYMFLEDSMQILKEEYFDYFPILKEEFLNGILYPDGSFKRCDYGHHYEIAQKIKDDQNDYISISTNDDGTLSSISIFNVTNKQKEFLNNNLEKLTKDQLKQLKYKNILE